MKPDPEPPSGDPLRIAEEITDGARVSWDRLPETATSRGLHLVEQVLHGYANDVDVRSRDTRTAPFEWAAENPPPRRVGRFEIERELGRGGMGVVYLGRDTRLGRQVAIKTLAPSGSPNERGQRRFEREARLLASLNHPHIATVHALEEQGGRRFLVLEYIEGETLHQRLARGPIMPREAVGLARAIADALLAAHELGILHRDLKPSNVMIDRRGRPRLLDFGLARALTEQSGTEFELEGTPGFISPERMLGHEDVGVDLFAFGALMYEAVAGRPAFPGEDTAAIVRATLERDPDWTAWPEEAPPLLREVVESCLAKEPSRRPRGAQEILARLADWGGGQPTGMPTTPRHLPRPVHPIVGRDVLLGELEAEAAHGRLQTLTGTGGVGKTRVAIELAWRLLPRCPGGAWFVDLAPLQRDDRVWTAAIETLGSRERSGLSREDVLLERLGNAPTLLVLDNCEHVREGAASLASWLVERLPSVMLVATSREPLRVAGERRREVASLPVPGETADRAELDRSAAARLFLDRARDLRPGFTVGPGEASSVAAICRAVDGIPLALELAAARIPLLGLHEIADRLSRSIGLLRGGRGASSGRHRTMRAAIGWSYDHLAPDERPAFRALSAFASGFDLESAAAIVGEHDEFELLDRISRLADKSLLQVQHRPGAATRYRLPEPVRQFARDMLDQTGEAPGVFERLRVWAVNLATRGEAGLQSPDVTRWLERLDLEHDNLLAALTLPIESESAADHTIRVTAALWRYWFLRGRHVAGAELCVRALSLPRAARASRERARLLLAHAALRPTLLDAEREPQRMLLEEAISLLREFDDPEGLALALNSLGLHWSNEGAYEAALPLFEEAGRIYEARGDLRGLGSVQGNQARAEWLRRDLVRAEAGSRRALITCRRSGGTIPSLIAEVAIAFHTLRRGERAEAAERLAGVLRDVRDTGVAFQVRAGVLLATSEWLVATSPEDAARIQGAAEAELERIRMPLSDEDPWWYEHDATAAGLRRELGESGYTRARDQGREWSSEEAIAQAHAAMERFVEPTRR